MTVYQSHNGAAPVHVADMPAHIKERYQRLALVSHESHVSLLGEDDDDTLIVSCDWLLWQNLIKVGRHAVYYELGILDWVEPDTLCTDLYIAANDWIYEMGEDVTIFRGVSLAKMFNAEMIQALLNYHRITRSVTKVIERFKPEEVWYFDFTLDAHQLDQALRKSIVSSIADECGITFVDRSAFIDAQKQETSGKPVHTRKEHGRVTLFVLKTYVWTLETASKLRLLFSSQKARVLVLVNTNMAAPLIGGFAGGTLIPIFLARTVPKKLEVLWKCLKHGVLLTAQPGQAPLSVDEQRRIATMESALRDVFSMSSTTATLHFAHMYFREHILNSGRLMEMACQVRAAERLLERLKPTRIVVDTARTMPTSIFIELANASGISVDYIWHSSQLPQNKKIESLGGDPRRPPIVTRCLTWGRANEAWLKKTGVRTPYMRVGSPIRDKYAQARAKMTFVNSRPEDVNVLVLQYTYQIDDLSGLNANMYENFASTVLELRRLGYRSIRFKLHPGLGRWKKSYFEKIAKSYGLGCTILKFEPFHEVLSWSDIVIGPAPTGAMYETLAAGKPYYAFLLSPHTLDAEYYDGFPLLTSVDQLSDALTRPAPDGRDLLDYLYDIDETTNPSQRFWEVLGNGLG